MRYKEILRENPYDDLEQYVRHNTTIPSSIGELIPRHPFGGGTVYRGLSFISQANYDRFMEGIEGGVFTNPMDSSWTTNLATAQEFATMEKSYDPTPSVMAGMKMMGKTGDFTYAYGGVVISTVLPDGVALDVSAALENSAESEVIVPRGKYQVEIAEVIVPYRRQYDTPEKIQQLYNGIMAGEDQDKIHFFTNSVLPHLSPEQATAYADKTALEGEMFRWHVVPAQRSSGTELYFKAQFDDFETMSPSTREMITKRASIEAKKFVKEILALPNEAWVSERSGIFVEGLVYVRDWKTIAKPVAARAAKIYHSFNDEARNMKTSEEVQRFAKGMQTLLQIMKIST